MDWDDVEEILFEGTREQILKLRCPDCEGIIEYEFDKIYCTFKVKCIDCGTWIKGCKVISEPKCAIIYGSKQRISDTLAQIPDK